MTVSSISSLTSYTASTASTAASTGSLSTDDFLSLLVAQLQNQNPLDPTDTTDMMNQLTSYASYNELASMNDQLSSLASSMNSLLASDALGYVGLTVEAYGDTASLADGEASWGYSLNSAAASTTIIVKNADGDVVYEGAGETGAGAHTFDWDGVGSDGTTQPDGAYTIEVSAVDASGNSIYGTTTVTGRITGVDTSTGTAVLTMGDVYVSLSAIVSAKN